jgi:hypothetical protein
MASLVIDIRSAEDSRDVVHRAVQALAEGSSLFSDRNRVMLSGVRAERGGNSAAIGGEASSGGRKAADPGSREARTTP